MKPFSIPCLLAAGIAASVLAAGAVAAQDSPPVSGKPANLCQDLLAFVKQPEPAKQAATTPQSQATAVSNPSGKTEGGKPADGGEPQQKSGLSGPPTDTGPKPGPGTTSESAPKPAPASAPASDTKSGNPADNHNARANALAKVPPPPATPSPGPKPDQGTVEKIEAAAAANDQAACRAAARSLRVAGVVMPPPLLALSALNLKFFAQ